MSGVSAVEKAISWSEWLSSSMVLYFLYQSFQSFTTKET